MNAISIARLSKRSVHELVSTGWNSLSIVKCRVPVCVCRYRMATSRGSELMRV